MWQYTYIYTVRIEISVYKMSSASNQFRKANEKVVVNVRQLVAAIIDGDVNKLRTMLMSMTSEDVNKFMEGELITEPLFHALRDARVKGDNFHQMLKLLLDFENINLNEKGDGTVLRSICIDGCQSTLGVEMLLQRQDIDVNKGDPAFVAAFNDHPDLFLLVIRHHKYRVGNKMTLFQFLNSCSRENSHFKASKPTIEALKLLYRKGADFNYPRGLLAYAVNFCSLEVCQFLL